jgi:4-hydroxybenzoate polyprenyltransferase
MDSKFFNTVLAIPRKIISELEEATYSFNYILISFISILVIRSFIESFTQENINYLNYSPLILLNNILHFYFAFISGAMSLTLLFYVATRVEIKKIMRVVLPFYALVLIGPVIDLIASHGYGSNMLYLDDLNKMPSHNLALSFLLFFGQDQSMTLGMRVETILACLASLSYFIIKGRSVFISICYSILVYALIFVYCAATMIIHYLLMKLGYEYHYSSLLMLRFYLILISITAIPLLYFSNKQYFIEIVKDMRWLRLSHYIMMLIFGCALAIVGTQNTFYQILFEDNQEYSLNLYFCIISIISAGIFSIITNNIADQQIDRVCNQARPLITTSIPLQAYNKIAYCALATSLIYAAAVGVKELFLMSVVVASYFIYSMPPVRFKRVLIFSKLIISLNSLVIILLGYILLQSDIKFFPNHIIPIFLIGFTLAANFIDIKDYEGDKVGGIITLPGLLGLRKAKILIGSAFFLTYISFALLPGAIHGWVLMVMGGLMQFYLVNKKLYDEKAVFLMNLISMAALIVVLTRQ